MTKPESAVDDFDMLGEFAHDLRSPLNSAKSFIELLEHSGDLNGIQRDYAYKALRALARVQQSIDELLNYTRNLNTDLVMKTCDTLEILDDLLEMLQPEIEAKRIRVEVDIMPPLQFIHADEKMISNILQNLLTNAIKYNYDNGRVQISAEDLGEFVNYDIRDTGFGIDEDEQPNVFKRFYRAKHKTPNRIEGTGLGLSIVKDMVERHGGQISLRSKVGEGSTFSITLPRAGSSSSDYGRERADDMDDDRQESREEREDSDTGLY